MERIETNWNYIWKILPVDEVPISHITNGVHPKLVAPIWAIYDKYMDPGLATSRQNWIYGKDRRHLRWRSFGDPWTQGEQLVAFAREKMKKTVYPITSAGWCSFSLILTISFARRFATYKACQSYLKIVRLIKLLSNNQRPIQLIFVGKATSGRFSRQRNYQRNHHFSIIPSKEQGVYSLKIMILFGRTWHPGVIYGCNYAPAAMEQRYQRHEAGSTEYWMYRYWMAGGMKVYPELAGNR